MPVSPLLRLYPSSWRARYGGEMQALLEERPHRQRDRLDLVRGAIDAWLHPATPSWVPIVAALAGGGSWTVAAAAVLVQPAPLDWPGYLLEIVPLSLVGAICLFVAATGCLLRAGEAGGRAFGVAALLTGIGYLAWVVALGGTILGSVGRPELAAAQSAAMIATIAVGLALVRRRDEPIGFLVLVAAVVMLIPWTGTWLAFGLGWTAIGISLLLDRAARMGRGGIPGAASS
jgi:hypothetical protein